MRNALLSIAVALGAALASFVMMTPWARANITAGGTGAPIPAATTATAAPICVAAGMGFNGGGFSGAGRGFSGGGLDSGLNGGGFTGGMGDGFNGGGFTGGMGSGFNGGGFTGSMGSGGF